MPEHTNTIARGQQLLRQLIGFQLSAETVKRLSRSYLQGQKAQRTTKQSIVMGTLN
jgi:hypothetical protein